MSAGKPQRVPLCEANPFVLPRALARRHVAPRCRPSLPVTVIWCAVGCVFQKGSRIVPSRNLAKVEELAGHAEFGDRVKLDCAGPTTDFERWRAADVALYRPQ